MTELSAQQDLIVQHGTNNELPYGHTITDRGLSITTPGGVLIEVPIHDGGVRTKLNRLQQINLCPPDHPALDTLGGYCEIYQRTALVDWDPNIKNDSLLHPYGAMVPVWCSPLLWFCERQTDGGGFGSTGYPTRSDAQRALANQIMQHVMFWETKVALRNNGDLTIVPISRRYREKPERVIRCGGVHYTIGPEPATHSNRDLCGHGGARFQFRMLGTGEIIISHNVWYQGRIPLEYRGLLPDNAEVIRTEQTR